eukprot:4619851-Amphidinium_carterae.3
MGGDGLAQIFLLCTTTAWAYLLFAIKGISCNAVCDAPAAVRTSVSCFVLRWCQRTCRRRRVRSRTLAEEEDRFLRALLVSKERQSTCPLSGPRPGVVGMVPTAMGRATATSSGVTGIRLIVAGDVPALLCS